MRIVKLKEFLAMPEGTLYHSYKPCVTGALCIKHETISDDDWYEQQIDGMPDASHSGELFSRCDEMQDEGSSYPLNNSMCRNALYLGPDQLFMVYEEADVRDLGQRISQSLPTQE